MANIAFPTDFVCPFIDDWGKTSVETLMAPTEQVTLRAVDRSRSRGARNHPEGNMEAVLWLGAHRFRGYCDLSHQFSLSLTVLSTINARI